MAETVQKVGSVYNWTITIGTTAATIVLPSPPGVGVATTASAAGCDAVSKMADAIQVIADACNVGPYRAYIKVQKYQKSIRFFCGWLGLIGHLFGSEAIEALTTTIREDGEPVWVEVQGGDGWEDYSASGYYQGGYSTFEDALSAVQAAKGLCKPRPTK